MKSNRTPRQSKAPPAPSARKKVTTKGKATLRRASCGVRRANSDTRDARRATPDARGQTRDARGATTDYSPLPGTLQQRGGRWWWFVALPGEDQPKARPLKPDGAKAATDDRQNAEKIAFEMWEQAVTKATERRVRGETDQTIARLKAQFLQKVRDFSHVLEVAKAKAEAEAQARADAEAKLRGKDSLKCHVSSVKTSNLEPQTSDSRDPVAMTVTCECCGATGVPASDVKRIDSGQLLCPNCLAALRAEVKRICRDPCLSQGEPGLAEAGPTSLRRRSEQACVSTLADCYV